MRTGKSVAVSADGLPCTYVKSWCPILCYGNARSPAGNPAAEWKNLSDIDNPQI